MLFIVHCGDAHQIFSYGSTWSSGALEKRVLELMSRVEVAPGLVLRDESGKLWKLKLGVRMEKAD